MGAGAINGTGIFVLTGTAAAGGPLPARPFDVAAVLLLTVTLVHLT